MFELAEKFENGYVGVWQCVVGDGWFYLMFWFD